MQFRAGALHMSTYAREISLVLVIKGIGLYILWALFFGPAHQFHPTPASTAGKILGNPPIVQPGAPPHE